MLVPIQDFTTNDGIAGHYSILNKGARYTILFCPGAGANSLFLSHYQTLAQSHPDVCLLSVDRWVSTKSNGQAILDAQSKYTVALLDEFKIEKVTIASHSAGVYQQLHLAEQYPSRVTRLVLLCTHIPAAVSQTTAATLMVKMPQFLFRIVGDLDSKGLVYLNKFRLSQSSKNPKAFYEVHHGEQSIEAAMEKIILNSSSKDIQMRNLDYDLVYERLPGIDSKALMDLYITCETPVTWYTTQSDALFGPEAAARMKSMMKKAEVEIASIKGTDHGHIYRRKDVWELITRQMQEDATLGQPSATA